MCFVLMYKLWLNRCHQVNSAFKTSKTATPDICLLTNKSLHLFKIFESNKKQTYYINNINKLYNLISWKEKFTSLQFIDLKFCACSI